MNRIGFLDISRADVENWGTPEQAAINNESLCRLTAKKTQPTIKHMCRWNKMR